MTDGKMFFKKMDLSDLQCNPFDMIGKTWYLTDFRYTGGLQHNDGFLGGQWAKCGEHPRSTAS